MYSLTDAVFEFANGCAFHSKLSLSTEYREEGSGLNPGQGTENVKIYEKTAATV